MIVVRISVMFVAAILGAVSGLYMGLQMAIHGWLG